MRYEPLCSSRHPRFGQCYILAGQPHDRHVAAVMQCGVRPEEWIDESLSIVGDGKRVRPGLYRHYRSDSPPYVVIAVSIRDEDGHGNPDAPRDVIYHSTRSFESGLANSRTEKEFTAPVEWPDGVVRPRFVRIEA